MGGGPNKEHLLLIFDFPEPTGQLSLLRQRFPYIEITYVRTASSKIPSNVDLEALYATTTILFTLQVLPSTPSLVPKLKLLQLFLAGIDRLTSHPLLTESTIPICTASGIHGPPVTEWIVGTVLSLTKHLYLLHRWQEKHQYGGPKDSAERRWLNDTSDFVGKRVGIAGYGSIGRQVARVFTALGAEVIAYTASPRPTAESRKDDGYVVPGTGDPEGKWPVAWYSGKSKEALRTFLRTGLDVLVVSLPLTKATTHLFGKEEFDILQAANERGCVLVNISRGKIINQPDLVDALNNGTLKGACLDVVDPEPLPEEDPLWEARNVVISPHVSALGEEYGGRAYDVLMTNLGRLGRGEALVNEVERKRGY